jgi:uncharacterized membrane protein
VLEVSNAVGAMWHVVAALVLAWLAAFFGRTLLSGQTPLIERIARVSDPVLAPELCRYTRRLTMIWCAYFVAASLLSLFDAFPAAWAGALVLAGSLVLFAGERLARPYLFPGKTFPGLWQQVRDTWRVWHSNP